MNDESKAEEYAIKMLRGFKAPEAVVIEVFTMCKKAYQEGYRNGEADTRHNIASEGL